MRKFIRFVTVLAAAAIGFGYLGAVHPALDTLSIARPLFGAVCLIGAFSFANKRLQLGLASIGAVGLSAALSFVPLGKTHDDTITVYSKNLHTRNSDVDALLKDIKSFTPDLVMLQELSVKNSEVLDRLRGDFPHQHICQFTQWRGIVVLSRTPFLEPGRCTSSRALAAARVGTAQGPVWAVSVHIPWPWPYDASKAETAASDVLSDLDGPMILAGDFNMVPWSFRLSRFAGLSQTRRAGPAVNTFTLRGVPLPIDHVLAPGGGTVQRRPTLGSDHAGLIARVSLTY